MDALFTWLSEAMTGSPWLAALAAAGWGVVSLVLSPCHLASIPLVVGFIAKRKDTTPRQAFGYALLFALGILGSIAAVLLAVGLHLLGVLPLPWERSVSLPRYHGKAAALLLGLIFGLALGPCTFAYLAPVLGVIFGVARTQPGFAVLLLLAYGIGHCTLIVLAGASTERVQRVLDWNGNSRGAVWMRRACGLFVLAGAAWLVVTAAG
jgi:cytochrome c-type biogenesis protein